jgi:hypothetical protein
MGPRSLIGPGSDARHLEEHVVLVRPNRNGLLVRSPSPLATRPPLTAGTKSLQRDPPADQHKTRQQALTLSF